MICGGGRGAVLAGGGEAGGGVADGVGNAGCEMSAARVAGPTGGDSGGGERRAREPDGELVIGCRV